MTTPAAISAAYTALRTRFTAAAVTLQIGETSGIQALAEPPAGAERLTPQGLDPGFASTYHVLVADLKGVKCSPEDHPERLKITIGDRQLEKRIAAIREIGSTVISIDVAEEFA